MKDKYNDDEFNDKDFDEEENDQLIGGDKEDTIDGEAEEVEPEDDKSRYMKNQKRNKRKHVSLNTKKKTMKNMKTNMKTVTKIMNMKRMMTAEAERRKLSLSQSQQL